MASLFGFARELRRRHVFRVTGLYLVGAWLVLQVADVVVEPIGLPPTFMTTLVWLVGVGLPIAIILGWRYDFTRDGLVLTRPDAEIEKRQLSLGGLDYAILGGVAIVAVASVYGLVRATLSTPDPGADADVSAPMQDASVVVLPFKNLSTEDIQDYLAQGLTEDLATELTRIRSLFVVGPSATRGIAEELPVAELAARVRVRFVLEGAIRQIEDTHRVNATMVDARTGRSVWSSRYESREGLSVIEHQLAGDVVVALGVATGQPDVKYDPIAGWTASREAYETAQQVRGLRGSGSWREAVSLLERALEHDPNYIWPRVTIAQLMLPSWKNGVGMVPPTPAYERLMEELDLIRLIDPAHPQERLLRGLVERFRANGDRSRSEELVRAGVNLQPLFAGAYPEYAMSLLAVGKIDQALAAVERAFDLSPAPQNHWYFVQCWVLFGAARYQEATAPCERTRNVGPVIASLAHLGRINEARERATAVMEESPYVSIARLTGFDVRLRLLDTEPFAAGLGLAGIPEFAIDKAAYEKWRVAGLDVKRRMTTRMVTGFVRVLPSSPQRDLPFILRLAADDTVSMRMKAWDEYRHTEFGRLFVENGLLCFRWQHFLRGSTDCGVVYHNPEGFGDGTSEYRFVGEIVLMDFSLSRADANQDSAI